MLIKNKKAIVLLSGGLDSAVTLYQAKEEGYECFCLGFDYGQRHNREIESAKKVAEKAGCSYQIIKIDLPWKGSSLLDTELSIFSPHLNPLPIGERDKGEGDTVEIPSTYVPGRNIIFLSFSLSYAEAVNADAIFIGAHSQDYSGYPDCRPEFYRAFINAAELGTKRGTEGNPIKINTPLINKNKSQIIQLGISLNVPFEDTWSCYNGAEFPCGECDSCYFRRKGFEEAGIKDPAMENIILGDFADERKD